MLRRLQLADMDAAAMVRRTAFDQALPWLAGLHTPEEDRQFFRTRLFRACEVWGAADGAEVVGLIAFREGWIDQLYVLPTARGGASAPDYWTSRDPILPACSSGRFSATRRPAASMRRRGFVLVEETDGSRNEEREPDARYLWSRGEA